MKQAGLDTITYSPDPSDGKTMISAVERHGKFTLPYTKNKSTKYQVLWDSYDSQNDTEETLFIINSLQPNFKKTFNKL